MGFSKLCLTGGPLDHRPNGRSKITSHMWSIEPSSIWMVTSCKFDQSQLRHLDQGAFLDCATYRLSRPIGRLSENPSFVLGAELPTSSQPDCLLAGSSGSLWPCRYSNKAYLVFSQKMFSETPCGGEEIFDFLTHPFSSVFCCCNL